ncbi:response regulator transcription factor [Streptomyces sp. NPDC050161]|uniref:response regulator transcription factor n=1 Tax=Streptomyces sp. NPDC050161 TaxID=3365604 RepID=UPI00379E40E6
MMHIAFFVLLSSSLTRFLLRHPDHPDTPWAIALAVTLALLYVLGPVLGPDERTAAGATGYLLKAERSGGLFAAIRSAAQGRTTLSPPVAGRVMDRMRGAAGPTLTDRERDILGQLARGLGNRDIARALFISEATVKTHLGRIYTKLGVDTRAGAVAVAKEQCLLPG